MRDGLYWLLLGLCGWRDMRNRRIPGWLLLLFLGAGAVSAVLDCGFGLFLLWDLLPGLLLCTFSRCSCGLVGIGDGIALLAAGLFEGGMTALGDLFLALFQTTLWGFLGIARGQKSRQSRLPLLPFLWLAVTVRLGLMLLGG